MREGLGFRRYVLDAQVGDVRDSAVFRLELLDHEPLMPAREGGASEGNQREVGSHCAGGSVPVAEEAVDELG